MTLSLLGVVLCRGSREHLWPPWLLTHRVWRSGRSQALHVLRGTFAGLEAQPGYQQGSFPPLPSCLFRPTGLRISSCVAPHTPWILPSSSPLAHIQHLWPLEHHHPCLLSSSPRPLSLLTPPCPVFHLLPWRGEVGLCCSQVTLSPPPTHTHSSDAVAGCAGRVGMWDWLHSGRSRSPSPRKSCHRGEDGGWWGQWLLQEPRSTLGGRRRLGTLSRTLKSQFSSSVLLFEGIHNLCLGWWQSHINKIPQRWLACEHLIA